MEPAIAPSNHKLKAYKSLDFGDATADVEDKLTKILVGPNAKPSDYYSSSETPVRIDEDVMPHQLFPEEIDPEKVKLQNYFGREKAVEIVSASGSNDLLYATCVLFKNNRQAIPNSGLALVEVRYKDVSQETLVAKFLESYPKAKKGAEEFSVPSDKHPGISIRFERGYFVDSASEVEAKLSVPTKRFRFVFKELTELTTEEMRVWTQLAKREGDGATTEQYFQFVKTTLTNAQEQIIAANADNVGRYPFSPLAYWGWYQSNGLTQTIYGPPILTVKATAMITYHLLNYRRSIDEAWDAKQREEKAKAEKASDF